MEVPAISVCAWHRITLIGRVHLTTTSNKVNCLAQLLLSYIITGKTQMKISLLEDTLITTAKKIKMTSKIGTSPYISLKRKPAKYPQRKSYGSLEFQTP